MGGIISRINYSLSKMTELTKSSMYHFSFTRSLNNKYILRSLTSVFFSPDPLIRLFDPRNCSSLFSRNLLDLMKRGDRITGVILTLLTIPIFIYFSINIKLIKRSSNSLVRPIGGIVKQTPIKWVESFYSFPPPIGSLSVSKDVGEDTYHHYYPDLDADESSSFHYGRLVPSNSPLGIFRKNTIPSRDGIALSYKDIRDWLDSINENNWTSFLEYVNPYIRRSYHRSPSSFSRDARESEFKGSILKDKLLEINQLSDNQLINEISGLLSEILSKLSKSISLQIETSRESHIFSRNKSDSMNQSMGSTADGTESLYMRLREERYTDSFFSDVKKILHLWNIVKYFRSFAMDFPSLLLLPYHSSRAGVAEFDSDKCVNPYQNKQQFFQLIGSNFRISKAGVDLHSYSQIIERFKKLVTGLISTIKKLYTIHNEGRIQSIDGKYGKSLVLKENLTFSGILCEDLGIQSKKSFSISDFRILSSIIGGTTNQSENSNLWNRVEEGDNRDSTDFLVRLYERDRFLYFSSIYTLFTSEYFHTLASEYYLRIKYQLGSWAGSNKSTDVTGIAIE